MQKIFSLFAAVLFAGSMMADQVSFAKSDFSKDANNVVSATKSGITISCVGNVPSSGNYITLTEGNTLTISSTVGNINAIDFTCSSEEYTGNLADVTGYDAASWTLSVDNPGNKTTVRVVSVVVTYTSNASVATPTFSVAEGVYTEAKSVEIACETAGATIYYNLDSEEAPTAASTPYTAAIAINEGKHVLKAIAIKDADKSLVATAEYLIVFPFTSLQALAAADYLPDPTTVTVTLDKEVIKEIYEYPAGTRAGVIFDIQRGGKDIKIFFQSTTTISGWEAGGKLSGTLTDATWTTYQSAWQLKPATGFAWSNLSYEAPAPTAIDNTEVEGKAVKFFENGQLVIIKNGVKYNAQGAVVR